MMTRPLTEVERTQLALSYARRTRAQLAELAALQGLSQDGSKAELIARMVANALRAVIEPRRVPAYEPAE